MPIHKGKTEKNVSENKFARQKLKEQPARGLFTPRRVSAGGKLVEHEGKPTRSQRFDDAGNRMRIPLPVHHNQWGGNPAESLKKSAGTAQCSSLLPYGGIHVKIGRAQRSFRFHITGVHPIAEFAKPTKQERIPFPGGGGFKKLPVFSSFGDRKTGLPALFNTGNVGFFKRSRTNQNHLRHPLGKLCSIKPRQPRSPGVADQYNRETTGSGKLAVEFADQVIDGKPRLKRLNHTGESGNSPRQPGSGSGRPGASMKHRDTPRSVSMNPNRADHEWRFPVRRTISIERYSSGRSAIAAGSSEMNASSNPRLAP